MLSQPGYHAWSNPLSKGKDAYSAPTPWENISDAQDYVQTRVMIEPSDDQAAAGKTVTYLVRAQAWQFLSEGVQGPQLGPKLPPNSMTIQGVTLMPSTDADGSVWGQTLVSALAGVNVEVTPMASGNYIFYVQAYQLGQLLTVDNNRDGQINLDNSDATTTSKPFRFWINDSKESGDVVSGAEDQIPDQPPIVYNGTAGATPNANYNQSHVQGRSDLVNFFPVALCLSNVLQLLPPSSGYEYHLYQADSASIGGAVKFVYTSLTLTNAFDYLTNTASFGYGANFDEAAMNADTIPVNHDVVLDANFLVHIQDNGGMGVILVEGCAATPHPLMLEIWRNGKLLAGTPLYLSIDGVEKMYRHKNLRDGADAPSGLAGDLTVRDNDASLPTQMSEPANYPDSLYNQWFFAERWFIFVVGSNVGGQNARGWESEVFKRMYWSGNKAKFVGVSWFGDPYTNNEGVFDYHMAVRNAFATAPSLASFVNGLSGNKTIAGHSLSCGLIASAIADSGMNVNNACLMDAAFAQECFDGDADDNLTAMKPAVWQDYPETLWAAHWHERFSNDARTNLTWRDRFAGAIGKVYNFYSSTEDALGEYDGEVPTTSLGALGVVILNDASLYSYVWVYQEKSKGNRQDYYLPIPGSFHAGSRYGGWGFNVFDGYLTNYPIWYVPVIDGRLPKTPAQIGTVTQDLLDGSRYNPLFISGWGNYYFDDPAEIDVDTDTSHFTGPAWIMGLYTTSGGDTIAADPAKRAQLLAEAIPALSLPVGAHKCSLIQDSKQFNMPAQFADKTLWPSARGTDPSSDLPNWHHSDMDQVAYPYLYKFYNKLVSISNQ